MRFLPTIAVGEHLTQLIWGCSVCAMGSKEIDQIGHGCHYILRHLVIQGKLASYNGGLRQNIVVGKPAATAPEWLSHFLLKAFVRRVKRRCCSSSRATCDMLRAAFAHHRLDGVSTR